jgi:hypothetical protein
MDLSKVKKKATHWVAQLLDTHSGQSEGQGYSR